LALLVSCHGRSALCCGTNMTRARGRRIVGIVAGAYANQACTVPFVLALADHKGYLPGCCFGRRLRICRPLLGVAPVQGGVV